MKYFKINHPCEAVIVADNEEKCKEIYGETISDIGDELFFDMEEISKEEAKELFKTAVDEESKHPDENELKQFDIRENEPLIWERP